jgi:homoserine trans-succinylase
MPYGYFGAAATKSLTEFRERAAFQPHEELMADFPEAVISNGSQSPWHSAATRVYRNWLEYVVSKRTRKTAYAAAAPSRTWVTWSR